MGKTISLLLVDLTPPDQNDVITMLQSLSNPSVSITWKADYFAAQKTLGESTFDLCIFNADLGKKRGINLLHQVQDQSQIPVIILADAESITDDMLALQGGATDYLVRSELTARLLERSIRYALKQKQREHTLTTKHAVKRELSENQFQQALEHGQFTMQYQPIINVQTHNLMGVEALVRWNHPQRGLISPSQFIHQAEENGFIFMLEDWILNQVCQDAHYWYDHYHLPIRFSVNLSARQFAQPEVVQHIAGILEQNEVNPHWFELEVTESSAMNDLASTEPKFTALQQIGIGVALDDFGIGHSSLGYLKNLPITTLKIDRAFVENCSSSHRDGEILKTIASLARTLQLHVIAEGVEHFDQYQFLTLNQCCDDIQGYYFSKSLTFSELQTRYGQPGSVVPVPVQR